MVEVCVHCSEELSVRAKYVLGIFLDVLGLGYRFCCPGELDDSQAGLIVYYGDLAGEAGEELLARRWRRKAILCIQASPLEGHPVEVSFLETEKGRIPLLAWSDARGAGVPLLQDLSTGKPMGLFSQEHRQIALFGDIVSSAFYLLSRWEEYREELRDDFDRFPGRESIAKRWGFLELPIVDAYIALLGELLLQLSGACRIPYVKKTLWPEGHRWALCLTHDVDWVRKWTVRGMGRFLLRGAGDGGLSGVGFLKRLMAVGRGLRVRRDPYDNLDDIAALEQRLGAKSTFFLLPGVENTRHAGRKILGRYPRDFDLRAHVQRLVQGGCEVELHGGFDSYRDRDQLTREREMLAAQTSVMPRGIRQHFLRYSFPQTARIHDDLGFDYDTSLGFGDLPGYRCGISYPFRLFDLPENRELGVTEIPLVIMDGSLGITAEGSMEGVWPHVERLLHAAEEYGGVCTVLWHNTSFCQLDDGGALRTVYEKLIRRGRKSGAWLCSCGELLRWWQWRNRVKIENQGLPEDGSLAYIVTVPHSGPGTLGLDVAVGETHDVAVDGCRSHQSEEGRGMHRWIRLCLYDWVGGEIRLRLFPR